VFTKRLEVKRRKMKMQERDNAREWNFYKQMLRRDARQTGAE
jgi:hypothetical protein